LKIGGGSSLSGLVLFRLDIILVNKVLDDTQFAPILSEVESVQKTVNNGEKSY